MGQDRLLGQHYSYTSIIKAQKTVSHEHVPLLYREPGILTGYRPPGKPFYYYLISIFQIHNESVNVWTHLLAFLLVLYRWQSIADDKDIDPQFQSVITTFSVCSLSYTFFSTFAHIFHSKSYIYHYTCFQLDYAGIGSYTLGCCICAFHISCYHEYFSRLKTCFLPSVVLMSTAGFLCCCIAKLKYKKPYPFRRKLWQVLSFGTQTILVSSIILRRYIACLLEETCQMTSLNHHTYVAIILMTSVFFFSSHMPEKLFPGKCDIIGQGHQIFHVLSSVSTLCQFDCIILDLRTHTRPDMGPDSRSLILAIVSYYMLVILSLFVLKPFTQRRSEKDQDAELIKCE